MFSPKGKYSPHENIQDVPQGSKPTIATTTTCRPTVEVAHSEPTCSAAEVGGNDMKYG